MNVEDELEALRSNLRLAEKNYEHAQRRTFELSARINEVEQGVAPLRSLLAEVISHCIPGLDCYRLDDDNLWRRARVAADGGPAVTKMFGASTVLRNALSDPPLSRANADAIDRALVPKPTHGEDA